MASAGVSIRPGAQATHGGSESPLLRDWELVPPGGTGRRDLGHGRLVGKPWGDKLWCGQRGRKALYTGPVSLSVVCWVMGAPDGY